MWIANYVLKIIMSTKSKDAIILILEKYFYFVGLDIDKKFLKILQKDMDKIDEFYVWFYYSNWILCKDKVKFSFFWDMQNLLQSYFWLRPDIWYKEKGIGFIFSSIWMERRDIIYWDINKKYALDLNFFYDDTCKIKLFEIQELSQNTFIWWERLFATRKKFIDYKKIETIYIIWSIRQENFYKHAPDFLKEFNVEISIVCMYKKDFYSQIIPKDFSLYFKVL